MLDRLWYIQRNFVDFNEREQILQRVMKCFAEFFKNFEKSNVELIHEKKQGEKKLC